MEKTFTFATPLKQMWVPDLPADLLNYRLVAQFG